MDGIYRDMAPGEIPWNIETPPAPLVELVESGKVRPCRALDLGCGAGNYAVYLAERGFEVTGVDSSPAAIEMARANAERRGVQCTFVTADVLGGLVEVAGPFDFAYDWELLHHIFPEDRPRYVETVHATLRKGGLYLSVCFSERDRSFEGEGKYRQTRLGTTLYLSSEDEIEALFRRSFRVKELRAIDLAGKRTPHLAVYALMEKP